MQKLLKISQQTFWQVIVKIATSLSGLIILGIITRTYGQSGTGNFTLALTYLAYFYTIADFGFNAHTLGRLNDKNEWQKLFGARIVWSLFLTVLAPLLAFTTFSSFAGDFKVAVIFGAFIVLFYGINITSLALFQIKHRYDLDIFPTILGSLAGVAIIFFVSISHLPVYFAILGYVTSLLIHSLGSLFLTRKLTNSISPIFDLSYIKNLFKDTWPIAGTLVLNTVYFRVDSFILAFHFPAAEVGLYNVAYQIFQSILVIPVFIMNAFYPLMLVSFKENLNKFKSQVKLAALGLVLISLLVSVITYILSPLAITIITGDNFAGSITSLRILSFGLPAFFLTALLMWVMVARNMYKSIFLIYFFGLAFNLIANLIFIPNGSFVAASWITGISEYLILILQIVVLLFL